MSLRIVPENNHTSTINPAEFGEKAAHAPGLQDVLRNQEGPSNLSSKINNRHPLEGRVSNWESTELNTRMETYRRIFGAGEPIKRAMELKLIEDLDFKPSVMGSSSDLHRDILLNKDTSVDWEDVYKHDINEGYNAKDFHSELEKKMGI